MSIVLFFIPYRPHDMTVSYEFSLTNRRGQRIVGARFVDAESEREYGIQ